MSDIAIRAEKIGKLYHIGQTVGYKTLRDSLTDAVTAPFRRLRQRSARRIAISSPNTFWALKDVSFEVKQGEAVGIIGRNGSGKSTLLKILSRITTPTEGYAEIRGRVASLLEVGTGFHPELTGRENIYLNGAVLGMKKAEIACKFDEIVAFSEIEKFLDTPVKRYSSGMYVRLAFAVAAHLEPEILVVDEVLAVGDAAFQKKCLGKMANIAGGGRTVLFVSHNMAAIRSICSRAILLSAGKIVFFGPTNQCVDGYLCSTSDDMQAEINTTRVSRPSGVAHDTTLRITRIMIDTPTGRAVLYTGEPITLVIEFIVIEPLEDVIIGWGIHSSDGARLFECSSIDSYGPIALIKPGKYSIRSVIPSNPLNPGLYTLHVGSRCAKKGLDWLPDVMIFRMDTHERFDSLWLESRSGIIRVASDWSEPVVCSTIS